MYTTAKCHGCGDPFSHHDGCPKRIVICAECRKSPKKLEAARRAMELHLFSHMEVKFAKARLKRERARVRTGDGNVHAPA